MLNVFILNVILLDVIMLYVIFQCYAEYHFFSAIMLNVIFSVLLCWTSFFSMSFADVIMLNAIILSVIDQNVVILGGINKVVSLSWMSWRLFDPTQAVT